MRGRFSSLKSSQTRLILTPFRTDPICLSSHLAWPIANAWEIAFASPLLMCMTKQEMLVFEQGVSVSGKWFVDDWDDYHLYGGEVHCGTNVQSTPPADWWKKMK